ncbi:hypothetical protein NFI96_008147, partial [Prochilodus magdalenae]
MLHSRSTAFVSGNPDVYKKARYDLRRSIKEAKKQYSVKLEHHYSTTDTRGMWQGLKQLTDYQNKHRREINFHTALTDELNDFYARFEALNTEPSKRVLVSDMVVLVSDDSQEPVLTVSSVDVRKILSRVKPRKEAGPNNIPGCGLSSSAVELADVFADIYKLSLAHALILTYFKATTIVLLLKKRTLCDDLSKLQEAVDSWDSSGSSGSFYEVLGDGLGLSKASISRVVTAMTQVLLQLDERITFPKTPEDIARVNQGFHGIADIPQVIGVIDALLRNTALKANVQLQDDEENSVEDAEDAYLLQHVGMHPAGLE